MEIGKILLRNFAPIYTAMKVNQIEIDFTGCTSKIYLFLGDMGSGKTAVLSTLHPFAYAGSFDLRGDKELILEDMEGYKEITFIDESSFFVIKHYYTPTKTGRSVKSYISKNGKELNANGNVTSFKELVLEELGLYEDFMRLIRLGPNVVNFADMKSSVRKEFITDLMEDIDIYSKYYKKINDDNRYLKNNLSNIVKKLERLHIVNLDNEKKELSVLKDEMVSLEKLINKATFQSGSIQSSIDNITGGNESGFISSYRTEKENMKSLSGTIDKIKNWMTANAEKIKIKDTKTINKTIERINKEIAMNRSSIQSNLQMLDMLYASEKRNEETLSYMKSPEEIESLRKTLIVSNDKIKQLNSVYEFENKEFKCTKDDLLLALSLLQEIEKIVQDINETGIDSVKECIKMIKSNKSIDQYVSKKISGIDEKLNTLDSSRGYENDNVMVLFVPPGCQTNFCPYYNRYNEEKDSDALNKIVDLESKRDYYLSMLSVSKLIDYIFMIIRSNKNLIDKLPENFFAIQKMLNNIESFIPIYDENQITDYITTMEEFDDYVNTKKLVVEIEKELSYIKNSDKVMKNIESELIQIITDIRNIDENNHSLEDKNILLHDELRSKVNERDLFEEYSSKKLEVQSLTTDFEHVSNLILKYDQQFIELKRLREDAIELTSALTRYSRTKDTLVTRINDIEYRIREFKTLNKEIETINEKFEEIGYIRKSLSSNEGIPLLFVQLYFQETKLLVNEMLDTVYHGEIEIDDFDIDENKFDVPYFKNGNRISDIGSASQGEGNFFSLALSFALMKQSFEASKSNVIFNIMGLDEIDGPFDKSNREKFIAILEAQMQSIGAKMVFLITHNNTFDNYDVNVVEFSAPSDELNNKNIKKIKIKKG